MSGAAGRRHHVRRRQERRHHRAVPGLRAPRGQGGAVQGAEHVQQLDGRARTRRRGRRDRPGPVDPGARRAGRARGGDEPGAAQARQRPAQPRRGDGAAGRRGRRRRDFGRRAARTSRGRRTRRTTTWPRATRSSSPRAPGSPAEINLRRSDYVNMGLARHAGPAGRGRRRHRPRRGVRGVLRHRRAARRGRRRLVAGFVVNKFRGDARPAAARARRARARCTGRPVYGVLPWHPDVWLDSEDALDLEGRRSGGGARRVAVVRLPRISNFTDVDALGLEPDLDVVFASTRAASPTPTWSCCPAPARRSPTWPGCATRGPGPRGRSTTPRPAGRCSGSAAAARCSAARSPTRTGSRGRRATVAGLGLLDLDHGVHAPRRCCAATSRPATRSTTAGSPARSPAGAVTGTMVHGVARGRRGPRGVPRRGAGRHQSRRRSRPPASAGWTCSATWSRSTSTSTRCCSRAPAGCCHRGSAMRVLLLGGTAEARALAAALVADGHDVTTSLAGRVARPRLPVGEVRIGGFGGVDGLRAARRGVRRRGRRDPPVLGADLGQRRRGLPTDVPLLRLERPGWSGDASLDWVDDHEEAAPRRPRLRRAAVPDRRPAGARPVRAGARRTGRCWRASSTRRTSTRARGLAAAAQPRSLRCSTTSGR